MGRFLVPARGEQGSNGGARRCQHCRLVATAQCLDLLGIAVQQFLHSLRNGLGVKGATVAVAQHGRCAIIAGNDDITALGLPIVKDIVGSCPSL